jgi:hypothetical protein
MDAVTIRGGANHTSLADAKTSCSEETGILRRQTGHAVQLIAAIPTDGYYAWTWAESDPRVDDPGDRTSAKVCVYVGRFTYTSYAPPDPASRHSHQDFTSVTVFFDAQIQEADGQDLGSMLHSVPTAPLRELDLSSYMGRVTHWAPW